MEREREKERETEGEKERVEIEKKSREREREGDMMENKRIWSCRGETEKWLTLLLAAA